MRRELRTSRYAKLRKRLAQARVERGMTQLQLAEALRRPQSFVSKVAGGERRLDVVEFLDICRAVGLSASALIAEVE
jgi:transcriptional regulator with XRE-family HTH domain